MPSTATITTFHTFTANTKARASQVNTNFSNFRGHSLPINTDTSTASDLTYDLGADDHRWRIAYLQEIDFRTSTTTATLILKGDTSATTGAFLFQIEGVTKGKVDTNGWDGSYMKSGSIAYSALTYQPQEIWEEFTSNGTFTAPAGVSVIEFEMCGGGGGGGTTKGGGGAGAAIVRGIANVTPGNAYSITVGIGGYGGGTGSNPGEVAGTDGASSSIAGIVTAQGGAGGQTGNSGATGTAGRGGIARGGGTWGGHGSVFEGYAWNAFAKAGPTDGQGVGDQNGGTAGSNGGGGGAGPYGVGANGGNGASSAGSSAAANTGAGGGGGGLSSANGGDGGSGRVRIKYVRHR